jgi:DNA-binding beta-propeller fold protein YncE
MGASLQAQPGEAPNSKNLKSVFLMDVKEPRLQKNLACVCGHGSLIAFCIPMVAIGLLMGTVSQSSATDQGESPQLAVAHPRIGVESQPAGSPGSLRLVARKQSYNSQPASPLDQFDKDILSPKSAIFSADGRKFYVNSLEGCRTVVYDTDSLRKLKVIHHEFGAKDAALFKEGESVAFDYSFPASVTNPNLFHGKPVEGCLSHGGRYLWVTYYRRSFDRNAQYPSALCIIDTRSDEIVRVMPAGPLPKMIACSPDNKWIAVSHWGDNTVGIIDVSGKNPSDFHYAKHLEVDGRMKLAFKEGEDVNRDKNCGCCLRGTVFTPDGKHLLIGKMSHGKGLFVFEVEGFRPLGTITGMHQNVRHMAISGDELFLSTNASGSVQKCNLPELLAARGASTKKSIAFRTWKSARVGRGARTISISPDGRHIYSTVNYMSEVVIVDAETMKTIGRVGADSFPVGMDISPDGKHLLVTAQGASNQGGNSVMLYEIN